MLTFLTAIPHNNGIVRSPSILDSARKLFLAQIDPDTVLANGKVIVNMNRNTNPRMETIAEIANVPARPNHTPGGYTERDRPRRRTFTSQPNTSGTEPTLVHRPRTMDDGVSVQ